MTTRPGPPATIPQTDVAALLAHPHPLVVDLRAPVEYGEDHFPGAHSVPLFDDAQRALVGLLYHRRSPEEAFARGIEFVLEKAGDLVTRIAELAGWDPPAEDLRELVTNLAGGGLTDLETSLEPERVHELPPRPVALYCWRGGLRSQSVIALLRALGHDDVVGLVGGYKGYRAQVRAELEAWQAPPAWVLRGLTGVGKTLVLRELERIRPRWTLDLEGAAGHRSSLLGMVGLEPVSQKTFETRLAERIRRGFPGPVVFEGESRRVGDAIIPRGVWEPLRTGTDLLLVADTERRIDVLIEDYLADPTSRPQLHRQLAAVEARMEGPPAGLVELLDSGRERELVAILLERYYDPLYRHSEQGKEYAFTVPADDPRRAALEVVERIEGRGA